MQQRALIQLTEDNPMPTRTPSTKRPPPRSKRPPNRPPLVAVAVLVLAVCALAAFLSLRPSSQTGRSSTVQAQVFPTPPITYRERNIYNEDANPKADIAAALATAKREHKRVLLDFGGDWCGDCQVLDVYMHQAPNSQLIDLNYIVVHIFVGHMDQHLDITEKYGVPINRGVPALAILDEKGKVLYAQKTGEFSDMSHMQSSALGDLLEKWKN